MLTQEQINQIVDIHLSVLGADLLPKIGKKYLKTFYSYMNISPYETIFFEEKNGLITTFCIVTFNSNTILTRTLKKTFLSFLISLMKTVSKDFGFLIFLYKIVFKTSKFQPSNPEIAFMCTSKNYQGQGIGSNLLQKVTSTLKDQGHKTIYVKTLNQPSNRAIHFYAQNGFLEKARFNYADLPYIYLYKKL